MFAEQVDSLSRVGGRDQIFTCVATFDGLKDDTEKPFLAGREFNSYTNPGVNQMVKFQHIHQLSIKLWNQHEHNTKDVFHFSAECSFKSRLKLSQPAE